MDWGYLITNAVAGIGAVLGIINTWHSWQQNRVRIQILHTTVEVKRSVREVAGAHSTQMVGSPAVSVINQSTFPVTLEEVGYELEDGSLYRLSRLDTPGQFATAMRMWIPDKLPQRLEMRDSIKLAWWDEDESSLKGKRIKHAYARTACGKTVKNRDRHLKALADRLASGENAMEPVARQS